MQTHSSSAFQPSPIEILNGGVYVDQNKFLCHADTIHWRDIMRNPQAELLVVPSNNSGFSCESVHDNDSRFNYNESENKCMYVDLYLSET